MGVEWNLKLRFHFMAKKTLLRGEYLGVRNGGYAYFIRYCDHCGEKVYLRQGSELEAFLTAVRAYRLDLGVAQYFRRRLHLPRLRIDWE